MDKNGPPLDLKRVRAFISSLHRLTLATRWFLLAARVLFFSFGRGARKHNSHWRARFCLARIIFFLHWLAARTWQLAVRLLDSALVATRDRHSRPGEWVSVSTIFLPRITRGARVTTRGATALCLELLSSAPKARLMPVSSWVLQ